MIFTLNYNTTSIYLRRYRRQGTTPGVLEHTYKTRSYARVVNELKQNLGLDPCKEGHARVYIFTGFTVVKVRGTW